MRRLVSDGALLAADGHERRRAHGGVPAEEEAEEDGVHQKDKIEDEAESGADAARADLERTQCDGRRALGELAEP